MNQSLALRALGKIMAWDHDRAMAEYAWLRLMSRIKYDTYRDYVAAARFIEALADWLQQFQPEERECAYEFIRHHLVYVGPAEMEHLVELFYPETVEPWLVRTVARSLAIPTYLVWARPESAQAIKKLLRKTLFLGLSDGARIDTFRRANVGVVSNEQVVGAAQVNDSKWNDLLRKLRRDVNEPDARFECVYLLDDFIATGTTLLRNESEGVWDGRLVRFWDDSRGIAETHFSSDWSLRVHHHLATHRAYSKVPQTQANAITSRGTEAWFSDVDFTYGMVLPPDLPIDEQRFGGFMDLIQRYYDPILETDHMRLGGEDGRLGFGKCALPLILEHNAPNNTVALLWAETEGGAGVHAMRPLFRRRQRHS